MNGQRSVPALRPRALSSRVGLVAVAVALSACRGRVDTPSGAGAQVEARTSALITLTRTGWVASASSTSGTNVPANALDGSATTRWSTSGAQTGQFFQLDMLAPQVFSEVTLDAGTTSPNFPRAYQLNVSNDGTTWTTVTTGTGTTALVTITFATQTARFIRINQTATNSTTWSLQEMNVFGLALSRSGWVATASSTSGTNVAANALDGSATTRWSTSGAQTGQFFQVDMQSPQTFNQITLDAGTTTTNFPRGYQVFVSNDGTNWGTAIATGTGTTAFISIPFPTQWARFIKINQTATNTTTWSIQELNVAGQPTIQTAQPRTGWVTTASSTGGTNLPANALDGSTTTRWSTSGAQTGQFFQVDMLTTRIFNQIVLDAGTTTTNFPRAYQVQISNNGTTFTTVTSGTGTTALVTINFPAQMARFIKINQTATNTTVWSIQEMTVSGQALSPKGWLPTATSTGGTDVAANALDGVATTRWSTAVAQANGQAFQVDMVTAQTFNQLTLDAGTSTGNFPRGYAVSVSNDGTNWGTPVATGTGSSQLVTVNFLTQTARFFKIVQTGTATNVWSIHELNVWRTVQPCDTVTCVASDVCHAVGVCDPNVGTCSNPVVANPTAVTCNDGNACTTTDRCTATGSCAGVTVVCTAQDQCHVAGTCANGVCSNPVVANPTTVTCNDGDACTTTDRCTATGSCAGAAVVCTAQDACHAAGTCTNGVCSNPVVANPTTVSCNDGNACTTTDRCTTTGSCAGVAVVCTAQDACHLAGTCTPATGVCTNPVAASGTSCSDGNACNGPETCDASGVCQAGTPPIVNDNNPCTVDACTPAGGVTHTPIVVTDNNPCTTDACNTTTGAVTHTMVAAGTSCSDGNPCNGTETCNASGACQLGTPLANNTPCSDGNACTQADTCQSGSCTSGAQVTCPGDACHGAGTCDPATGYCINVTTFADGVSCDDGNRCSLLDTCQKGTCMPGPTDNGCRGPADTYYVPVIGLGSTQGSSHARGINKDGVVVGADSHADRAVPLPVRVPTKGFRWTEAGGMEVLPSSAGTYVFPAGISKTGVVAGTTIPDPGEGSRVFRYDSSIDTQIQILPIQNGAATSINEGGQITGHGYFTQGHLMYRATGNTIQVIPGIDGDQLEVANAIDTFGTLLGYRLRINSSAAAIRYSDALGLEYLNHMVPAGSDWNLDPLGDGDYLAYTNGTNGNQIVGAGHTGNGDLRGFVLTPGPDGSPGSGTIKKIDMIQSLLGQANWNLVAHDINTHGEVVGGVYDWAVAYPYGAFIWVEGTGTVELNKLIDPASGWSLNVAYAINDSRQIVGYGTLDGHVRAFTMKLPDLSPCPGADLCHTVTPRDLRTGACAAPVPVSSVACQAGITLRVDGVVDVGGGKVVAVFGFKNSSTASIHPASNVELIGGIPIPNPQPAPPIQFPQGDHPGAFLPTFNVGQTVTWTVDGESVSASVSSQHLTPVPPGPGGGIEVRVGATPGDPGTLVIVKANIDPYKTAPDDAEPEPDPEIGDEFFGALGGSLSVSPTGAAIYTVPITTAPGIAGMAPHLSLAYNSQGGDGIAGQGWEIGGLSAIHRCPKTRPQDGFTRSVMMDMGSFDPHDPTNTPTDDGLCLDGKRIFERAPGIFESELSDFSSITLAASDMGTQVAHAFKVVTKSGETRYYGFRDDSRVAFTSILGPTAIKPVAIWALDRVMDAWGNYYEIHYNNDQTDFATTGLRVTQIKYTGHISGGTDVDNPEPERLPTAYGVSFAYEPRTDPRSVRFGNYVLPRNQRLTTITTPTGIYTMGYDPVENVMLPSRLKSISYCRGSTCLKPLEFNWDTSGVYGWAEEPQAGLPFDINSLGGQFLDLNSDGRLDFVWGKAGSHHGYRSTGSGWVEEATWAPKDDLVTADHPSRLRFADMDGDGRLDQVWGGGAVMMIWYNRIQEHNAFDASTTGLYSIPWTDIDLGKLSPVEGQTMDVLADLNGDGRADVARFGPQRSQFSALLNEGTSWSVAPSYNVSLPYTIDTFHLEDINRDGLPDLVMVNFQTPTTVALLNRGGPGNAGAGAAWTQAVIPQDPNATTERFSKAIADVDGDGFMDNVYFYLSGDWPETSVLHTGVSLANGNGFAPNGSAAAYVTALTTYGPKPLIDSEDFWGPRRRWGALDVNGDGLSDLITGTKVGPGQGQLYVNTGATWVESEGRPGHQSGPGMIPVPAVPGQDLTGGDVGAALVDIDGDGLADIVQASSFLSEQVGLPNAHYTIDTAWRNTFRRPIISKFPDGLTEAQVQYAIITTAAAHDQGIYTDTAPLATGTRYVALPMNVVASVSRDPANGTASVSTTTYAYNSLRSSASGRGLQGFHDIVTTDPSGIKTKTTYGQAFPFTGLPVSVQRYRKDAGLAQTDISLTETKYCDGTDGLRVAQCLDAPLPYDPYGPLRSLFIYPIEVKDTAYGRVPQPAQNGALLAQSETTTTNRYDVLGNPTNVTVVTKSLSGSQEQYRKVVENQYGAANSSEQRLGKVTLSTVTTQREAPVDGNNLQSVHVTSFEYSPVQTIWAPPNGMPQQTLALTKKKVEYGKGVPLELHTAYEYDTFGNVTATTSCADDLTHCAVGAQAAAGHVRFRTSRVSYDPNDYNIPPGAPGGLDYTRGWYPVRTTNALGQTEFSAYDPRFGLLQGHTDLNGVSTCTDYDNFGQAVTMTERCGTAGALITTSHQYLVWSVGTAKVVTVTRPPSGSSIWAYRDAFGRVISMRSRGFDGRFVETQKSYDYLGRPLGESKPAIVGDLVQYWKATSYDKLGRVWIISNALGKIDSTGGNEAFTELTETYDGATVTTTQTVRGEQHTRAETKNLMGKAAQVVDGDGNWIRFTYDADGHLTGTATPGSTTSNVYDARGRKIDSFDPDMGHWHYVYDGFGQLITQTDAKNKETTFGYDLLGRVTSKSEPSTGAARWVYDQADHGIGKLASMTSAPDARLIGPCSVPFIEDDGLNRAGKWFAYDQYGQLIQENECTDGDTFTTDRIFDDFGRTSIVRYPVVDGSRFSAKFHYAPSGQLTQVLDGSDDSVYWAATAMNSAGQVTSEFTRNGVSTVSERNAATGWLLSRFSTAEADGGTRIQDWTFEYDVAGNLMTRGRSDLLAGAASQESFTYDKLDRLKTSTVSIPGNSYLATESYDYDAMGNIHSKAGKTYLYTGCLSGGGSHAVCSVGGGPAFTYDANGNLTIGSERTVSYNTDNKPTHIQSQPAVSQGHDTGMVDFIYGADGNRVVQVVSAVGGPALERTVYVGLGNTGRGLYERTIRGTDVEHVQYIYAGGAHGESAFALRVVAKSGSAPGVVSTKYQHYDHLGSLTAVSDESGHVISAAWGGTDAGVMGYDPWGARRSPAGQTAPAASFGQSVGRRGFTGHETIPNVGLVNMNGRVYDPSLGRFLSPDPNVQLAGDLQSYNRYSYALNNPLRYTDPTGYFFSSAFDAFVNIAIGAVAIAVCAGTEGAGCGFAFALLSMAYNTSSAVASGASFEQVVNSLALQMGFAIAGTVGGGGLGGYLVTGNGEADQILRGAIGGAFSGAWGTPARGGDLGSNALTGAVQGAMWAAAAWVASGPAVVSEGQAQGGGGSGAAMVERHETVESVLAEAGYGGRSSDDLGAELLFDIEQEKFLASAPEGHEVVADGSRLAVRIARGLRILQGIDDRAAFSAMRRGEGAYSASEREARGLAQRYSTSSAGGGSVVRDTPKPGSGEYSHYHGLNADGARLPGHSWFGRAASAIFFILDANGDGTFNGIDIFELANPLPVPLEAQPQIY